MKVEITGVDINCRKTINAILDPVEVMGIRKEETFQFDGKIYCNVSDKNNLVEFLGAQQIDIKTVPVNFKKRINDLLKDLEKELNK